MLAEDFDGKVQVADNHRISVTQRRSVQDALDMAAAGMDAEAICKKLEETGLDSTIYITVEHIKISEKGRVESHQRQQPLGNTSPFKTGSGRYGREAGCICEGAEMKQARSMMITAITRDLETWFDDVTGEKNVY